MTITAIPHSKACEQRLLGVVAECMPTLATFNLRNLRDGAAKVRREGLAPDCDCGRIELAKAIERRRLARKRGASAEETKQLWDDVTALRTLVHTEERDRLARRHAQERAALEVEEVPDV